MGSQTCGHLMERSCIKAQQKINLNDTAISVLYMLFNFLGEGEMEEGAGLVSYFFLFLFFKTFVLMTVRL